LPFCFGAGLAEGGQEALAIVIVFEDVATLVSTIDEWNANGDEWTTIAPMRLLSLPPCFKYKIVGLLLCHHLLKYGESFTIPFLKRLEPRFPCSDLVFVEN
jgi:hypothetical protein